MLTKPKLSKRGAFLFLIARKEKGWAERDSNPRPSEWATHPKRLQTLTTALSALITSLLLTICIKISLLKNDSIIVKKTM